MGILKVLNMMSHLLLVGLSVQRGLSQQHRALLGGHAQFIVEGVVPHLLHVLLAVEDAGLDRVLEDQDALLSLGPLPT